MDFNLHFSDVPKEWAICFQHDCPLADTCLRYHAASLVPGDLKHHECVLPGARSGDTCSAFVSNQPVRLARGMKGLLSGIDYGRAVVMRRQLYEIFGSKSQFYRYSEGRWPIGPDVQARVSDLFHQMGIASEPQYDECFEGYNFISEA